MVRGLRRRLQALETREQGAAVRIEIWEEDEGEMVRSDGWRLSVSDYAERERTRTSGTTQGVTSIIIRRSTLEAEL